MMKKEVILIGGGGHCVSCIDVIESTEQYSIAGIVDIQSQLGKKVCGYEVIATDDDLIRLVKEYPHFHITLGQIKTPRLRIKTYNRLKELGADMPVIVSPLARLSSHAQVGQGSILMHHTLVNARAQVGVNCIINSGALIEHDAQVGDHCHVSTGAIINGNAGLGRESFFGSRSVMYQGVTVKESSIVSAGSVVTKSFTEGRIFSGNPAEKVK